MKNFSNLLQVAVTGFLLFCYVFISNNPQQVFPIVLYIIKVAVLISISVVIVNVLSFLFINVWWFHSQKETQPSKLLKLVLSVFLYAGCIFIILRILGQDTTVFFTTSGLFTAIIGFAMQNPLGNLLSGVFLQIAQPFHIGDRIQIVLEENVLEGVVESVDWNSTDIRLDSGELTYIPNSLIFNGSFKLITSGSVSRTVEFTTPGNHPPNQVMDIAYKAVLNLPNPNINLDKPIFVRMSSYGQEEVNYQLSYYPQRYNEAEKHTDSEIRCRIWYAMNRAGFGGNYQPTENEQLRQLVSTVEFFRDLSVEAQRLLVQNSKTLLFDRDELLDRDNLLFPAMFLVVRGCVIMEQELVSNLETIAVKPFSRRTKVQSSNHDLKPRVIEQVASELAQYVGPVAFSLTYQTAKNVSSLYWLYANVAAEIRDIDRREAFLRNQPQAPTEQFQGGDFFAEMALFLGEELPKVKMITVEETELLAITPAAVATALQQDELSINTLSQLIIQYHDNYLSGTLQEVQEVSSRNFTLSQSP